MSCHQGNVNVFDKIFDERGELTVLEGARQLPFEIMRVFYVNNLKARGQSRTQKLIELLIQCLDP